MKTPIVDFAKEYKSKNALRLHMPGHKGLCNNFAEPFDITEIDGADSLFSANGIIKQSMDNASELFGADTFYSTEGSSLSIRAMLYLTLKYAIEKGKKPIILAGRNAHKTLVLASSVLDLDIRWIKTDGNYLTCNVDAKTLENQLCSIQEKPVAVYLTSPDYLGNQCDIQGLSCVCKKYGVLLLVDNAHGAYLKFLQNDSHPITKGADMCCDSAHKTLPALTGASYLHINKNADGFFKENALDALALFGSTSPSYLILQSLDSLNAYLDNGYKEKLNAFAKKVDLLKERLTNLGFTLIGNEKLKITISTKPYGYTGNQINQILQSDGIVCEFYDDDFIVFMLSVEFSDADLLRLEKALEKIDKKQPITVLPPVMQLPNKALSIKDGMFSKAEEVDIDHALGKIYASATVSCPPAVPIVISGEVIDKNAIECFKYYKIQKVKVVKKD